VDAATRAAPGKARKILRRTLSGGALAGSLAGLLWWSQSEPRVVPLAALVVVLCLCFEVSRMGSFALVDLLPPLLVATFAAALLSQAQLEARAILAAHLGEFPDAANGVLRPGYWRDAAFVGLSALAAHSIQSLRANWFPRGTARLAAMLGVGALLAWQLAEAHHGDAGLRFSALAMGVVVLGAALFSWSRADMRRRALFVALLAAWIVPPLFALEGLRQAHGLAGLALLLVASKVGDTFGYYVGGAIGKRHPFPRLSPGKTVAGCVASLVGCVAVVVGLHLLGLAPAARHGTLGVALAAVATNLAAQAGDLLESHAKRKAGVKDSSGWFGPSGGLFDQVDSLLLTVPVAVACWPLAFHGSP
jgi:phosphatidate cytidylyltransferase